MDAFLSSNDKDEYHAENDNIQAVGTDHYTD